MECSVVESCKDSVDVFLYVIKTALHHGCTELLLPPHVPSVKELFVLSQNWLYQEDSLMCLSV